MADTQEPTITAPADTAVSAPAATETPVVTPTVSTETVASSTETPAVEVVKTEEPAKAEPAIDSVLAGDKTAKPDATEKKDVKPEGAKATETKVETPAEVKVDLPVYEAFKTPENVKFEGENLETFTKILGKIETSKLDHAGMQSIGQELIDFGTKAVTDSITRLNDSYVQIHNEAKKARFESLKADPILGGDKLPETISALQKSVSEYGGSQAQIADFRKEVSEAGIDASPALCRLIYNMQQKINKYTTENDGGRMVPGAKPAPSKVKDYQRFYSA